MTTEQSGYEEEREEGVGEEKLDPETEGILESERDFGFARVYAIELKYKEKPDFSRERLFEKMQLYTGALERPEQQKRQDDLAVWEPSEKKETDMLHFFHLNYPVRYADAELPAQTSLMAVPGRPAEEYETAVQQAWHWPRAGETLAECRYSVELIDMMASGLDPKERLSLITGALRAVLETVPCDAVYFRGSDKLLEPGDYLTAIEAGSLLYGAMNIRFFNVEGTGSGRNEMLMDTIGLAALGIPDVQCHYYDLEPNDVAQQLTNLGYYLFDRGDVISDGETFGSDENVRWRCEHQYALAAPHRVALDIDPGRPYYAGRQNAPLNDV
ncbi:DUF4261 domain-containing protein [Saccharibacillus sp. CPCC 101409]|uniref:DUF4261 domain-containing protein n=1 Tax=Saccharibacillus sp. CPCC 101409 TaxID=3058041 RepID=UPI0026740E4B|nr:DUF4261 domain-containing protein [Saccharibacillus sp. CPCC 101409]MDO3410810.1 DUF4261 domain-containing protein [Saccharibacillus sp. CPCC 101409]